VAGVQRSEADAATILPVTGGQPFAVPLLAFVLMILAGALMRWKLAKKS
jgi:hypothetical protein